MQDPVRVAGATGVGSLPGDDIDAVLPQVFDDWPDLPYLPELPARGPGADMLGRTAAALVDLHVDLQPAGWRLVARPGADERRAAAYLDRDLDALSAHGSGYTGPFKVQLAGPWTLAAQLELPRGGRVVRDPGAVRDVTGSLAEGVRAHLEEVRRRLPGASLLLQLDEPSLPAVLAGGVATESRLSTLPAVDAPDARDALAAVVAAAGAPVVVHCCAADVPIGLLVEAGAAAVSYDLAAARVDADELAEQWEAGLDLWPGVVDPARGAVPALDEVIGRARALAARLGVTPAHLGARTVLTPACGLAGATPERARTLARLLTRAHRSLAEVDAGAAP